MASVGLASISAKIGWRSPVVALIGVVVALRVIDRCGGGVVEGRGCVQPRNPRDDQLARTEAVGAVVRRGIDVLALDVGRHREQIQVQQAARVGVGAGGREVVVGPGLQADGRVEEVAAVRVVGRNRRAAVRLRDRIGLRGRAATFANRAISVQRRRRGLIVRPLAWLAPAIHRVERCGEDQVLGFAAADQTAASAGEFDLHPASQITAAKLHPPLLADLLKSL